MKKQWLIILTMLAAVPFLPAQQPPVQANTAILAPPRLFITVVTPNGGEEVLRGAQQTVQWTKVGDVGRPTVQVKKGGAVVAEFARVTPEGPIAGKYRWTWNVPADMVEGSDYRLRLVSENGRAADESDRNFRVVASKIEVYMPRAGDHFRRGSAMTIHFRCFNVRQNVRVYPLNFANYPIASDIRPGTGIVEWRTAGTSPDGMVIMPASGRIVVCTMDGTVYAESQAYTIDD